MRSLIFSCALILVLVTSLIAGCGTPAEPAPNPLAPDVTLDSGYNQLELEEAVLAAGGGCDTGTPVITDNNNGTYTVECASGENAVTASGNINIITRKVEPKLETAMAQFEVPEGRTVECGYLIVPEDRSQPDGPTVRLHYAIFKTDSKYPFPDPVVYLEGGPGGHALEAMTYSFNERFAPFLANRDFIVFDQRGTGYSEPSLYCQECVDLTYDLLDQDVSPEEGMALVNEALSECHDRLVSEGINLAAYNSAESAADLNDLRIALGYEEWNLFGISYGTRLALTAMRDYPEGIRSVILDSAYPLQVDLYEETPANLDRALDVFFESCAADPVCKEAYPALEDVFWELVDVLNETPATFPVTHALSGETYEVLMDGDDLIGFLFQSLYSTEIIPLLPKAIFEIQDGNYTTLAILQGSYLANTELVSTGMYYSVQCNEEVSFSTPEELNEAYGIYPRLQGVFYELSDTGDGLCAICREWEAGEADPVEDEAVYSDIPTLVLSGEYDPITPPQWGQLIAGTLSNSYYYLFPGVGHGVSTCGKKCPLNVALAFLDAPMVEPDVTCVEDMDGPAYLAVIPGNITLVPFVNYDNNVSGLAPESWEEVSPGVYTDSSLGLNLILQQAAWGVTAEPVLALFSARLGLKEIPKSTGKRKANGFTWSLYEFEVDGLSVDMAIADYDKSSTYTLIVLLQSMKDEHDIYYEEVYLPAIDALTPIKW